MASDQTPELAAFVADKERVAQFLRWFAEDHSGDVKWGSPLICDSCRVEMPCGPAKVLALLDARDREIETLHQELQTCSQACSEPEAETIRRAEKAEAENATLRATLAAVQKWTRQNERILDERMILRELRCALEGATK